MSHRAEIPSGLITDARCVVCECTDSQACCSPAGDLCSWVWVERSRGVGMCSECDKSFERAHEWKSELGVVV